MTTPVRPPRDGGEQWREYGQNADDLEVDPNDPRVFEVVYANGQRVLGGLKHHENRQKQGYQPYWWRPSTLPVPVVPATLTGSASNYYLVHVNVPARATSQPYTAECLDLIEALGMTFNEGEAFKAIWRGAAARKGNGKPGTTALYDAEKVAFYGGRMVAQVKQ